MLKDAIHRLLFKLPKAAHSLPPSRKSSSPTTTIPRDVRAFIDGYPGLDDDPDASRNLRFYSNTLRCQPDNLLIDEIHQQWFGAYDQLEHKHGFIQWLFPIREEGMNRKSQALQPHEIHAMKVDPEIIARVIKSYELILDFYGMRLVSRETGLLGRVLPPKKYKPQYRNLVRSSHNYLRITRILKCLSELGLERLTTGFLLHVLNEQSEFKELGGRRLENSMDQWWANCFRNPEERACVRGVIKRVRAGDFVFTRKEYEKRIADRKHLKPGRGSSPHVRRGYQIR